MNSKDGIPPAGAFGQLDQMWFRLRSSEQNSSLTGGCSLRLQFLESHLLLIPVSGRGWITVDGRYGELRAGAAFVCLPGQLIEACLDSSGEPNIYILRFDVFSQQNPPVQPGRISSTEPRSPSPWKEKQQSLLQLHTVNTVRLSPLPLAVQTPYSSFLPRADSMSCCSVCSAMPGSCSLAIPIRLWNAPRPI